MKKKIEDNKKKKKPASFPCVLVVWICPSNYSFEVLT
jgi:hypothetical protein